jgi:hypothetical protein
VRTYVLEPGRSAKRSFPVAGPYPVTKISGSNVEVKTREGTERLHLDGVMRCPIDLLSGVTWAPVKEKALPHRPSPDDVEVEYVIERLVSHARGDDDTCWLIRVRWSGYDSGADTWEPAGDLPADLVRKYERRKKLQPGLLTQLGGPVTEPRLYDHAQALKNSYLRAPPASE